MAVPFFSLAQQSEQKLTKKEKKAAFNRKVDTLLKRNEDGALIFHKYGLLGYKLNTDGGSFVYEHGKFSSLTKNKLWWIEIGERKDRKQQRLTPPPFYDQYGNQYNGNSYIYGKENNFYYIKWGVGQERLLGNKATKNGVAVSVLYGGGLSLGLLKPYYLKTVDSTGQLEDIKYNNNDTIFLNTQYIFGYAGWSKGLNEIKLVPGLFARGALRFEFGHYKETISAVEVGVNAEYYTQNMPIMALIPAKNYFINGYISILFGERN